MKIEYIYALISILLWSTTATVTKLLLGTMDSMKILLMSSAFAFTFLLILNLVKGNLKELKKYRAKDYIKISFIGILGTFLYNLFLYLGINSLEASQAFIINYLWPIMTVIFACIILKEKINFKKIIAIILSFAGVIIVVSKGKLLQVDVNNFIGMLFCIFAAMSYGLFSVLNKKENYNKFVSMMLFYLISFIICLIYELIFNGIYILETNQLLGTMYIGIFTSAIAFTTWALAIEKGNIIKISNMAYITPFISMLWTTFILKENFSIYSLLGLIVIILGIFIQIKEK